MTQAEAPLDPNLNPYREDLAAKKLEGRVQTASFADPLLYQVTAGVAALRAASLPDAEQLSQALHGDTIEIYEERDGFGWGQMQSDGYVGWFDMAALSAPVLDVTRKVAVLRTYAFSEPKARSQPHFLLSLGAQIVETGARENGYVECARCGWVYESHLSDLSLFAQDPVDVALQFLNAPYQWGGIESLGLDCSGLIQTAAKAAGRIVPRDSYMMRTLGEEVPITSELSGIKRGDIVCWKGHVALMVDEQTIIHANGFHMQVQVEGLKAARARIGNAYGDILTIRRLP